MEKRKAAAIVLLMLCLLAVWAGVRYWDRKGTSGESFTITAFSIGKADSLLLQQGETAILVDTGEEDDGEFLRQELEKRGIERLDLLLVTHFDKDHVGSAAYLMDSMEVDTVMLPDYEGERPEYVSFCQRLAGHPDVRRVRAETPLSFGELGLRVYPAEDPESLMTEEEYDNDLSLVTAAEFGACRFLLTGDIEKARIKQMLTAETDWSCDWMKLPHHGRYQKALRELLERAAPRYAVVCCSEKNPMEEETGALLEELGISVWDTVEKNVVTQCTGQLIEVEFR